MIAIEFINGIKRLSRETNKYNLLIRVLYQTGVENEEIKPMLEMNRFKLLKDLPLEIVIGRINALDKVLKSRSLSIDELHGYTFKPYVYSNDYIN